MHAIRIGMTGIGVALVASIVGIAELRPVRLAAGTSNTIVINSVHPVWLNVQIESATGHVLPQSGVRYAWSAGDRIDVSSDGRLTCAKRADSRIRVVGGALKTELTVLCRPVARVAFTPGLRLVSGGASQSLPLSAFDVDGRPVPLRSPHVRVGADPVVALNGLLVEPKRAGITWADVSLGDCIQTIEIAVDDSVSSVDSLGTPYRAFTTPMQPGGANRWRLGAGRYELWLHEANDGSLIDLGDGARCVGERGAGKRFECIVKRSAIVAIHGTRRTASDSSHEVLSIRRLADSTVARAMAIARIKRRIDSRTVDCPVVGDRK